MNAYLSGVDLAGALLRISLGEQPEAQPEGSEGVTTRLGLMGLLDAAGQRSRRRDVVRELILLARASGRYQGSIEELVPLASDPLCVVPLAVVLARLLISPTSSARLARQTIDAYSLSPMAIERLHQWM
jgi:hypothetical protein